MPSVGFEPTISAGERPQTYASDRAATGTGCMSYITAYYHVKDSLIRACTHIKFLKKNLNIFV